MSDKDFKLNEKPSIINESNALLSCFGHRGVCKSIEQKKL